MNESIIPQESSVSLRPSSQPSAELKGIRGWLLALCLMLTVVGPIISAWLMATEYANADPLVSKPAAVQVAVLASLLLSACAVGFGAYAGIRLWLIRPNALTTVKHALLFGLAVDVVITTIQAAAAQDPSHHLLFQVVVSLVPSLIFFTLCFAYLNRSKRVHATYGPYRTDA
jgi:hypothetical protein